MSKFFAGFLFALSLIMLLLELTSSKRSYTTFLVWLFIGGLSVYKLCQKPARAA